ncbi:hypothetical protein QL285_025530 [Trifolium repens]|nr:hypothetical protein QL285_025530 [Trifolium repens]
MWKTLISEPYFAKLHFQKTPVSLMIRAKDHGRVSRTLYHLECQPEKFEIGSDNHVKLEPFKLPLRDTNSLVEKQNDESSNRGRESLYITSRPDLAKFNIVNSCNGLLCLTDLLNKKPLVICNPVTGEFIRLPKATTTPFRVITTRVKMVQRQSALGYLPKTNEYKVIKMLVRYGFHVNDRETVSVEIHTLGTSLWRNVEVDSQVSIPYLRYPTCVNGAIHWIGYEDGFEVQKVSIMCFCLESERFQSFPSPPHVFGNHSDHNITRNNITMGELKGFLYICDSTSFSDVTMWVMNEYGNGESWTKLYNIGTLVSSMGSPNPSRYLSRCGFCFPIKHFEEGAAILLYRPSNCFMIYCEPERYGFKVFQIHGSRSVEIIPHIPSLIPLKDVVKGDNIEVLNVHSGCAKFKLHEENEALSLCQPNDEDLESIRRSSSFHYDDNITTSSSSSSSDGVGEESGVEILNCVKKMKILIDDLTSTSSGGEAFGEEYN